ncbi:MULTISPECIES: response regulator [Pseudanabaena]|uniref:Response regulator receiver protein n=2 Tax=Pseudanabaena TaxID=1152 RepID=L8N726_9CYAN|nr:MULTISPECIES: response regulator [Pseudanabaena]ELS34510.1 response regulator receiver protein [Pseudanabaena biceps PCC 7429]MDG3493281.1 response regulator [Pseudanabaena catenata USMAC16]
MAAHKILVIDDSRVIRNMVRDMLPPANFEVLEAADGIKGLEMIQQQKPWMIMLDFLLPRMSGFEVYETLQQSPELRRIPLVLMSGRKEEVTSKIAEPFEDKYLVFIEKPFEQKELITAIKKAMVLVQKMPPISVVTPSTPVADAVPQERADDGLLQRIEELEAKHKLLEQQVASQQKQFQQLVDFIKKKLK